MLKEIWRILFESQKKREQRLAIIEQEKRNEAFRYEYPLERFIQMQYKMRNPEHEYGLGCWCKTDGTHCSIPLEYPCTRDENNVCSYTDRKALPEERIEPFEEALRKNGYDSFLS